MLIGRIELVPPLRSNEQALELHREWLGRILLLMKDHPDRLSSASGLDDLDGRVEIEPEKAFFASVSPRSLFLVEGRVCMHWGYRESPVFATIPMRLRIDPKAGDEAIYIGTIRIERDEYFRIARIEVRDELDREKDEIARRFPGIRVRTEIAREFGLPQ